LLKVLSQGARVFLALCDVISCGVNAVYAAALVALGVLILVTSDGAILLMIFGAFLIILPIAFAGMSMRSLRRRASPQTGTSTDPN